MTCRSVSWLRLFPSASMIAYLLSIAVYCILELLRDAFQSKVSILKIILEVKKSTELWLPQSVQKSFFHRHWKSSQATFVSSLSYLSSPFSPFVTQSLGASRETSSWKSLAEETTFSRWVRGLLRQMTWTGEGKTFASITAESEYTCSFFSVSSSFQCSNDKRLWCREC